MQHLKPSSAPDQSKDKLADYYAQQIDQDMEELWKSGEWNGMSRNSRVFGMHISAHRINDFSDEISSC